MKFVLSEIESAHFSKDGFEVALNRAGMLRRRVRGEEWGGDPPLPPGIRQPEHISTILKRIGFGKRGQDDERHE